MWDKSKKDPFRRLTLEVIYVGLKNKEPFLTTGKASQVPPLRQVVRDARRPEVAPVRARRQLALPLPDLPERIHQTHQRQEPPPGASHGSATR